MRCIIFRLDKCNLLLAHCFNTCEREAGSIISKLKNFGGDSLNIWNKATVKTLNKTAYLPCLCKNHERQGCTSNWLQEVNKRVFRFSKYRLVFTFLATNAKLWTSLLYIYSESLLDTLGKDQPPVFAGVIAASRSVQHDVHQWPSVHMLISRCMRFTAAEDVVLRIQVWAKFTCILRVDLTLVRSSGKFFRPQENLYLGSRTP